MNWMLQLACWCVGIVGLAAVCLFTAAGFAFYKNIRRGRPNPRWVRFAFWLGRIN